MPTYEYKCKHCKHRFEALQSMTAEPLKRCPECGRRGLQRLIGSGVGVIFKGSGFYGTDYKRGSSAKGSSDTAGSKPAKATGEAKD
jgi:putative FmdB family regulatory protein